MAENLILNKEAIESYNKDVINLYRIFNVNNIVSGADGEIKVNCLDSSSILKVFQLIYLGTDGNSRKALDATGLKDIVQTAPKSMLTRSGVFLRNGIKFHPNYQNYKSQNILGHIPRTTAEAEKINKAVAKKFKNWYQPDEEFLPVNSLLDKSVRLYVKDQSLFVGEWLQTFDEKLTRDDIFYTNGNQKVQIPMMRCDKSELILCKFNTSLNCLFVSLPYLNNYAMFIAIPTVPLSRYQLLDILFERFTAEHISDFYHKEPVYKRIRSKCMPKFEYNTEWQLNNHVEIKDEYDWAPYLKTIFSPNLSLGNLSDSLISHEGIGLSLSSVSNIINDESGTRVETITELLEYDCAPRTEPDFDLEINRDFFYCIVDPRRAISKIGVYWP